MTSCQNNYGLHDGVIKSGDSLPPQVAQQIASGRFVVAKTRMVYVERVSAGKEPRRFVLEVIG